VFTDKNLHDLAVIRMANLSLEHGHCDASMPPNWRLLGPQEAVSGALAFGWSSRRS
jgi:hypothetical protein